MAKHLVKVWEGEEPREVTVVQKSKSVWIAVGQHMEKEVRVQGRTEGNAISKWRDAAHYRSN